MRVRSVASLFGIFVLAGAACSGSNQSASPSSPSGPPIAPVEWWSPTGGEPLTELPVLRSEGGVLEVTLDAKQGMAEVAGSPVQIRGYNGSFIGPTLHLEPGDTLKVTLINGTDEHTNIHYHGLHVSPSGISDNVLRMMPAHSTSESVVELPPDHEQGLFWYHAHVHGVTEGQVATGMVGMLEVGDIVEAHLPPEFADITQRLVTLKDLQICEAPVPEAGHACPTPGDRVTELGYMKKETTRLVNGQLMPTMSIAPGETQLWRLSNLGTGIFYDVALDGHTFTAIAEDGSSVWHTWEADHLVIPPGKRYEVLVQGGEAGSDALRTLKYDQGFQWLPDKEMAALTVEGDVQEPLAIPDELSGQMTTDLTDATIAKKRRFVFTIDIPKGQDGHSDQTTFRINDQVFAAADLSVSPQLGTVEEWTLVNNSDEEHPFHIHVNDFQVMSIDGKPYHAEGLQDVVTLPVGSSVVIRNPFDDYAGKFVFHCHILFHEDNGMMQVVNVVR